MGVLDKAVTILTALEQGPLTLADLVTATGQSRATAHRLAVALEVHRFLARLGFTPLVLRRVVNTATLRRRLAGESKRSALEDLLSRRRSLRARAVRVVRGCLSLRPLRPLHLSAKPCVTDATN